MALLVIRQMKTKTSLLLLLIFLSCDDSKKETVKAIKELVPEVHFEGRNYFVIIPDIGCSGCILEATSFLMENIDQEGLYFIWTKVGSKKELKFRLGEYYERSDKVILDFENTFLKTEFDDNYPLILYFDDEKLVEKSNVKPGDLSAFRRLSIEFESN